MSNEMNFLGMENNGEMNTGADQNGLVFDLATVEEPKGFEVIPKGTYDAIVDEMEFGESKAGNPMITVKYQLTDPEYEGRILFDYWVLAGKGAEFGLAKLKKFLVRICPETDITAFNPETFCDDGEAIGKECKVKIKVQTQKKGDYKGEKRNQVQDVLEAESGSFLG